MASNLACVGLAVSKPAELRSLVRSIAPWSEPLATVDGIDVARWEDPSGARLVLGFRHGNVRDLLPSFAAEPSARLASIQYVTADVAHATVLDEHGEQATALAIEFEERRLLRRAAAVTEGTAGVVALGVGVEVFADEDAFRASPVSLLDPDGAPGDPPPHYVERGWAWPPHVGTESFFSSFAISPGAEPSAHARLAGTVIDADVRTVELTGQQFVHALVHTVGFDAHVCFPADGKPAPSAGAIVHGTVFLVGTMTRPDGSTPSRRRWLRRAR